MKKLYDFAVKTGSYKQGGEDKNKYENIGAIMEGDNGPFMFLKRTFNPAGVPYKEGSTDIIVSLFKPKKNEGGQDENSNSDIPF